VIVCSCNVLTDKQICAALAREQLRVTQVHACLGCRPKCGQCFATIKAILEQPSRFQSEAVPS
jgi:bacterioferritin-associated ferredoxin